MVTPHSVSLSRAAPGNVKKYVTLKHKAYGVERSTIWILKSPKLTVYKRTHKETQMISLQKVISNMEN